LSERQPGELSGVTVPIKDAEAIDYFA